MTEINKQTVVISKFNQTVSSHTQELVRLLDYNRIKMIFINLNTDSYWTYKLHFNRLHLLKKERSLFLFQSKGRSSVRDGLYSRMCEGAQSSKKAEAVSSGASEDLHDGQQVGNSGPI